MKREDEEEKENKKKKKKKKNNKKKNVPFMEGDRRFELFQVRKNAERGNMKL